MIDKQDAYDAVIRHLEGEIDQLNATLAVLKQLRGTSITQRDRSAVGIGVEITESELRARQKAMSESITADKVSDE